MKFLLFHGTIAFLQNRKERFKMISEKNMDKVSLVCHATVCHMFAIFCNPKYRGENFVWKNFPDMIADQCETQVFMANIRGKDQEAIKEHARNTGRRIAQKMIEEAGFVGG